MALNIKSPAVEQLVSEVVRMTGETKTEAIRRALSERRDRLAFRVGRGDADRRVMEWLEREVWPLVPADQRGRRITRREEDAILGFGTSGV